ncbi:MAG: ankyrin repeat domain-containing protein [Treponema sp.]|nr:ankyrin repeat domain-containing protein [Treponema sp.]
MNKNFFSVICLALIFTLFGCVSTPKDEVTLHDLIKQGKIDEAKDKFANQYDINAVDEDGNTALHLAAQINNVDLVTFLVIKGANSEIKNMKGQTPLHAAIDSNGHDAAAFLASIGKNLFAKNADGMTALDVGLAKNPIYYDLFITEKTGSIIDDEGKTIVHHFVNTKDKDAIVACVNKAIPISVKDLNEQTPLDVAFENVKDVKSVEIAALLILSGATQANSDFEYFQIALTNRNLNYRFEDGQTPLHISSIHGHEGITTYLLANSAATNVQDSTGATPLHEAVRYGHKDIAKILLDAGANVNAKDNLGKTPILVIIPEDKRNDIYDLLITYKADVAKKDMYGDTVLHIASMTNVSEALLKKLVAAGAEINARNKDGVTPLALAIRNNIITHAKFYAENNADINSMDKKGNTPLTLALKSDETLLKTILHKKNILSLDSNGNTPLHVAIIKDANLQKLQYIISLTDDVNARNAEGNNALYLSILKNRQRLGEMLLAKNADIFSSNNKNYSPLRLALKAGGSVMNWIITSQTIKACDGSKNTVLHYAAEWGLEDAIELLIKKGADISAKNASGETPLFNAAKTDNADIVNLLVKEGSKLNIRDNLGSTPLHIAVRWDASNSAKKLISLGIDVDAQNISGKSALAEAVVGGKYEIAKLLLTYNADPNTSDVSGKTVLMDAIKGNNPEVVKLLLVNGANPQIQEINGRNAYHEAASTANVEVIDIIRNAGGNPLSRDKNGNTPFSISLNYGNDIIKAVLGTDKTVADSDGNTPIHILISKNEDEKHLENLINWGYPIDTRNSKGYTPLAIAIEDDNIPLAKILLSKGANPFVSIDKHGTNAISIALKNNNKTMLENIVKYAGTLSDIQGNTILHYAAKTSTVSTIKTLISYGLDVDAKNISNETPYMTAVRWKRNDAAKVLQSTSESK